MGTLELLRRAALLAGVCGAAWYALWSPPVLYEVRRADFAREYERRYGQHRSPMMGSMDLGRELLRRTTDPGSLEAFIARSTEPHLLAFGGAVWNDLHRTLSAPRWFAPQQPPVDALRPDIEAHFRRAGWTVMYMPAADGYLEFRYETRPRKSTAPAALVYPLRVRAPICLALGLALWLLLPWPARYPSAACRDRLPVRVLDLCAALFAGIFFAIPLYFAHSTAEALGEDWSGTLICWSIAAAFASILLWTAHLSAWAIRVVPGGLREERLAGARMWPFGEMAGAGYTVRGDMQTGYYVRMRDGYLLRIPWSGVLHAGAPAQAVAAAEVPRGEDLAE